MDKVNKETVEVRLEAHVQNLVEMRMVDVRKHTEHLLVDALTRLLKHLGEASLLPNPGLAGRRGAGERPAGGGGGRGGRRRAGGLCREQCLVVDPVRDPLQNVLDVCRRGETHWVLVGVEPGVVEPVACQNTVTVPQKTKEATHPGPADMDGQFRGVQKS